MGKGVRGAGDLIFFNIFLLVVSKQDCILKISFLSLLQGPKQSLSEGDCTGGVIMFLVIIICIFGGHPYKYTAVCVELLLK
jgi:hypothetical protein